MRSAASSSHSRRCGGGMAARGAGAATAMPVMGFLYSLSPEPIADRLRQFRQGLKDNGFVEGENVTILYRWAENHVDRLATLAADLVSRQVAVVAAGDSLSAFALKAATTTIPICFPSMKTRSGSVLSRASRGRAAMRRASIFSRQNLRQSGWSSCVSWCREPFVSPYSSIRQMPPIQRPRSETW